MKKIDFRFWLLAGWLAVSLFLVTSVADFRIMMAAVINLYFCVSALKKYEKSFNEVFEKML